MENWGKNRPFINLLKKKPEFTQDIIFYIQTSCVKWPLCNQYNVYVIFYKKKHLSFNKYLSSPSNPFVYDNIHVYMYMSIPSSRNADPGF